MTGFVACMVAALSCWQPESIERLGIEGQKITLSTVADDGVERCVCERQHAEVCAPQLGVR